MISSTKLKVSGMSLAILVSLPLTAAPHPDLTRINCERAKKLVKDSGHIVLSTGTNTYKRFVAHAGYCSHDQRIRPAWEKSLDLNSCFVGYVCEQKESRSR